MLTNLFTWAHLTAAANTSTENSVYTLVYVLVGLVTLFGGGSLLGVYKWAKRQGVRDANIDRVVIVVLGDGKNQKPLTERMDAQDRKLDEIQEEQRKTQTLTDTVTRSERKLDRLTISINRRNGQSDEIHDDLRRRVVVLERRGPTT